MVLRSWDWPGDWRAAGWISESTDLLTNSFGQAANALHGVTVFLNTIFVKSHMYPENPDCSPGSVNWYRLANRLGVRYCEHQS